MDKRGRRSKRENRENKELNAIRTVAMGKKGTLSRKIFDEYLKRNGPKNISAELRKGFVYLFCAENKRIVKLLKAEMLGVEIEELLEQYYDIGALIQLKKEKLESLGYKHRNKYGIKEIKKENR